MLTDSEWDEIRGATDKGFGMARAGAVRLALLFGSAAVAFALIIVPMLDAGMDSYSGNTAKHGGVDRTITGSIGYAGRYTVRKSILQPSRDSICVIRDNGVKSGDC